MTDDLQTQKFFFRPKTAGNCILNAIPQSEFAMIQPFLKQTSLARESVLHESGADITECFFLGSSVVSCMKIMRGGKSAEVGLVGREGFTGEPILVGGGRSSHRAFVHVAGDAVRIDANELQQLLPRTPKLERLLFRFGCFQALQAQQVAACNVFHTIEQRLARWILMVGDLVDQESLPFTHDSIARVLSTRRATVSVAARRLRDAGGVDSRRGKLYVLDQKKLERLACECYRVLLSQKESLLQSFSVESTPA